MLASQESAKEKGDTVLMCPSVCVLTNQRALDITNQLVNYGYPAAKCWTLKTEMTAAFRRVDDDHHGDRVRLRPPTGPLFIHQVKSEHAEP
jgi:hypothetical protein